MSPKYYRKSPTVDNFGRFLLLYIWWHVRTSCNENITKEKLFLYIRKWSNVVLQKKPNNTFHSQMITDKVVVWSWLWGYRGSVFCKSRLALIFHARNPNTGTSLDLCKNMSKTIFKGRFHAICRSHLQEKSYRLAENLPLELKTAKCRRKCNQSKNIFQKSQ